MKKFLGIILSSFFFSLNSEASLFNKKEFKFERCYTSAYSDHDSWVKNGIFLYWEWEINLKDKTATRISAFKDDNKVDLKTFPIKAVTRQYIQTSERDGTSYVFERKTGKIQITTQENKHKKPSIMKCEKFGKGFF
tara:strand:+ start:117 stop:524 length:408 start_codon:yes stop_codon:yes gene_type:complete